MNEGSSEETLEGLKKTYSFFKKRFDVVTYVLLFFVVYLALWIRTRNLPGLRDITTGGWTLGPDLDPFLFLRWSKDIVENGSLFVVDPLRYIPLGYHTNGELILLPHLMAWFHNFLSIFSNISIEHSAALFPVVMFGLTVISFFILTRELFRNSLSPQKANYAALISSGFLSIFPSILPRTIAGIPEKESAAFFFMFTAFYFLIKSWNSHGKYKNYLFALLSGIFTAGMSLIWGGFVYIFFVIGIALLSAYFLHSLNYKKIFITLTWMISSFAIMIPYSSRYDLLGLLKSTMTIPILIAIFSFILEDKVLKNWHKSYNLGKYKIPKKAISFFAIVILGILVLTIVDFSFIAKTLDNIKQTLIEPIVDRFGVTVAENRQPYLREWTSSFGPTIGSVDLSFWIMIFGIAMFFFSYFSFGSVKKKVILTSSFVFMFLAIGFSRYSPSSLFNGVNFASMFLYFGSIILFLIMAIKACSKEPVETLSGIRFEKIFVLSAFIFGYIAARSSVRTTMVLVPAASIVIGYLLTVATSRMVKDLNMKKVSVVTIISAIIILSSIFSAYQLYRTSNAIASSYVPSAYTQQWQSAMKWVRDSTPKNAVFAHWWDYGYWVQTIGERATVLDGGNAIVYWDYLMGRYGLTETNQKETLDFFYSHNVTHFLIDSTDIGKYTAFSSIGSNESYDRRSWIPTFLKDGSQTSERKNYTLYVYSAGSVIDKDIKYNLNGSEIFLPEGKAYIAAVAISVSKETGEISEVYGIYFMNQKTYQIPLRYYYSQKDGFVDTGKGLDAGIFIYPRVVLDSQGSGGSIDPIGAMLYLSPKTVKSNLARYYLYGEENSYVKLAHSEEDSLIKFLRSQGQSVGDFIYYNEFKGPIKIWNISYPKDVKFHEDYVTLEAPKFLSKV